MLAVMKHRTTFYNYDGTDSIIDDWPRLAIRDQNVAVLSIDDIVVILSDEIPVLATKDVTMTLAYSTMHNRIGWIYRDATVYRDIYPWSEV